MPKFRISPQMWGLLLVGGLALTSMALLKVAMLASLSLLLTGRALLPLLPRPLLSPLIPPLLPTPKAGSNPRGLAAISADGGKTGASSGTDSVAKREADLLLVRENGTCLIVCIPDAEANDWSGVGLGAGVGIWVVGSAGLLGMISRTRTPTMARVTPAALRKPSFSKPQNEANATVNTGMVGWNKLACKTRPRVKT